ncbi:hypothetical protein Tco_0161419, partial [Tanacetum coccineum]
MLKPGMHRIATSTKLNREPQLPHASRNTSPHVSKSTGVTHPNSVSRPQLKSYQVKDKSVEPKELKITGGGMHGILETRMGAELDRRRILKHCSDSDTK